VHAEAVVHAWISFKFSRHAEVIRAHHLEEHVHLVRSPSEHFGQASGQRVAVHQLHHRLRHDRVQVGTVRIELVADPGNEGFQALLGHLCTEMQAEL